MVSQTIFVDFIEVNFKYIMCILISVILFNFDSKTKFDIRRYLFLSFGGNINFELKLIHCVRQMNDLTNFV